MNKIIYVVGIIVVLLFIIVIVIVKEKSNNNINKTIVDTTLANGETLEMSCGTRIEDILANKISPSGVYYGKSRNNCLYTAGSGRWPSVVPTNINCPNSLVDHKCMYPDMTTAITDCANDTNCVGMWARDGNWMNLKDTIVYQLTNNELAPTNDISNENTSYLSKDYFTVPPAPVTTESSTSCVIL